MPIDFPPRTPNVPDTNPITLGSKRYLWTGEQWAANNFNLHRPNNTQDNSSINFNYNPSTALLQAEANISIALPGTFVQNITVSPNGTYSSFGTQPEGVYRISYVSGHYGTSPNISVVTMLIGITDFTNSVNLPSMCINYTDQYARVNLPTTIYPLQMRNGSGFNSGPGVTWALYRIN